MTPDEQPTTTVLIDLYLNGELNAAQQQAVIDRLRTDAAFRDEVRLQQALTEQLRRDGRQQLRAQMQQWDTEAAAQPVSPRSWAGRPIAWVTAACMALGLLGVWWFVRPEGGSASATEQWLVQVPLRPDGMGYAGNGTDSIWVLVRPRHSVDAQYQFTDTLYLWSDPLVRHKRRLALVPLPNGRYQLTVDDSTRFTLERGFRQARPLQR